MPVWLLSLSWEFLLEILKNLYLHPEISWGVSRYEPLFIFCWLSEDPFSLYICFFVLLWGDVGFSLLIVCICYLLSNALSIFIISFCSLDTFHSFSSWSFFEYICIQNYFPLGILTFIFISEILSFFFFSSWVLSTLILHLPAFPLFLILSYFELIIQGDFCFNVQILVLTF